jgi:branched-subunit amino acid ABC-type transport system permease component
VDAHLFTELLVNGVILGAILAISGIGLTLVYGILNLSNFAHGDTITMGAYASFFFAVLAHDHVVLYAAITGALLLAAMLVDLFWSRRLRRGERIAGGTYAVVMLAATGALWWSGVPAGTSNLVLVVATLLSVGASCATLAVVDLAIWRPLRRRRAKILTLLLVSIGLSLILRNSLHLWQGADLHSYARPAVISGTVLGIQISDEKIFVVAATLALIVGVHVLLRYTRMGKAMRATAENPDLARVSGIDTDRVVLHVWLLAGALTAIAGVFYTLVLDNAMTVNMGAALLLPSFAAVILGGIGSAYGAMAGGFLVGIAMKTSALWLGTAYEPATAFILLILVILVRPQGLFGSRA